MMTGMQNIVDVCGCHASNSSDSRDSRLVEGRMGERWERGQGQVEHSLLARMAGRGHCRVWPAAIHCVCHVAVCASAHVGVGMSACVSPSPKGGHSPCGGRDLRVQKIGCQKEVW